MKCPKCGTEVRLPSWAVGRGETYEHPSLGTISRQPVTVRCPTCKTYVDINPSREG